MTGSPLETDHIRFLERLTSGSITIKISQINTFEDENAQVYRVQQEQMDHILQIAEKQHKLTPVVIVLEATAGRTFVRQAKKSMTVTNLYEMAPNEVDAVLKQ